MAYLLELLNGTLVDTTALVDQVTGGGRLTRVDVADNDDVNVGLFLTAGIVRGCYWQSSAGEKTYPMLTVVYGRLSEVRLNFLKRG